MLIRRNNRFAKNRISDFREGSVVGASLTDSRNLGVPLTWPFHLPSLSFVGDSFEKGSGWTVAEENSVGFSLSRACQMKYAVLKVHASGKRYTKQVKLTAAGQLDRYLPVTFRREPVASDKARPRRAALRA